uniref:Uncharacterized protein n=1 Tax=viral metagenome TaxID=1070528 RepID=A0A6C0B0I0_9ZZZZ
MTNQIFKKQMPNEILFTLLELLCTKNEKYYLFNYDSYKKGIFTNDIPSFINTCKPFYHISKQKYLDRKLTYNNFITLVRQICNFNKITYTSVIKYDKSTYNIIYYIYF